MAEKPKTKDDAAEEPLKQSVTEIRSKFETKPSPPGDAGKSTEPDKRKPYIRILLAGRTGHGKSATGNSLLGEKRFKASNVNSSVTVKCQWERKINKMGQTVEVVDTPGFCDTKLPQKSIEQELYRALMLTSPGFHAIAFVMQPGRFTDEMKQLVDTFFNFFGNDVEKFAFIIFTYVENQTKLKQFLGLLEDSDEDSDDERDPDDVCADAGLKSLIKKEKVDDKLYELIMKCGGNIMIIDNDKKNKRKAKQVQGIFDEINRIKQSTNHGYFRNTNFQIVDEMIRIERENSKRGRKGWNWVPDVLKRFLYPSVEDENDTPNAKQGSKAEQQPVTTTENLAIAVPTDSKAKQAPSVEDKHETSCANQSSKGGEQPTKATENPASVVSTETKAETVLSAASSDEINIAFDRNTDKKPPSPTFPEKVPNDTTPKVAENQSSTSIQPVNVVVQIQHVPPVETPKFSEKIEKQAAKEDSAGVDLKDEELVSFKEKIQNDDSFLETAVSAVKCIGHKVVDVGVNHAVNTVSYAWNTVKSWFW